mmetsp:Transcript_4210/g.7834  ORF Transcript_4210/g.7834 Transcript_4210/m.7834 type:complete len:160 (+) Transcript_4210:80-559(+)|eukprot:CAMPEP_0183714920 /NCGR_PEP_ID=MMETSP0737-20130205/9326_1 /TAXON_ID=385413 /ORGANISM="Thalassiosira miniscula, Strain CCMP1093" /LENGTH=159 /DNA_ID=CAMNT_0025943953 /DNA_START=108 /DNA_END=587 /DNA_ORIENTATION=+
MQLRTLAVAAAFCVSSTEGFAFSRPSLASPRTSTALDLMSAAEVEAIMAEAESCAQGECALDEVESLLNNLQDQQSLLSKRIEEIDTLVADLEKANGADNRPVDEVRETVRAIFRVFAMGDKASGNDYPALSKPMGYSGETKGGGKTAYDVLPPKPITK